MAAPAVRKSILIHVLKGSSSSCYPPEVDYGTDGYDFAKILEWHRSCPSGPHQDPDQGRANQFPNAWFIMEPAYTGFRIFEICSGLSRFPTVQPASCFVEPSVYEIGSAVPHEIRYVDPYDSSSDEEEDEEVHRKIRRCNLRNPSTGWEVCGNLKFNVGSVRAAVACKHFIYILGPLLDCSDHKVHFGYVYDTIEQQGYMIDPPSESLSPFTNIWAPREEDGVMLVAFPHTAATGIKEFYFHSPTGKTWSPLLNQQPLPSSISGPTSVLDGILYICDNDELLAYDCSEMRLVYSVQLPKLCINSDIGGDDLAYIPHHLVALSKTWLCIIGTSIGRLFCAHVEVCFGRHETYARLSGVQYFLKDVIELVYSCVAL